MELEGAWAAIINMKRLFKKKVSRSKLEKSRRKKVERDATAISPAKEQLLLRICGNPLEIWPNIGRGWSVSGQKGNL